MDRAYVDHHHVVARYLADQLSEEERRAFETFMVQSPDVVHDLEAAVRMKVGLAALNRKGELDELLKSKIWYRDSRWIAIAASIATIAIGAILWLGRAPVVQPALVASLGSLLDRTGKPLSVANSYSVMRMRSSTYDAEIQLPTARQAIELRVLPEVEAHPALYRVTIARIGDDDGVVQVGLADHLAPREDGFISLFVDSEKFTPGRYRLALTGDRNTDAADVVSNFRIKLLPPPTR